MSVESHELSRNGSSISAIRGARLCMQTLGAAREGSSSAVGRLFEACRDYLLLVANQELASDVRQKVAASDLVQQSLWEACQEFDHFKGDTDAELRAWLRRILLNNVMDATRGFCSTGKRDIRREVSLSGDDQAELAKQLAADDTSPSGCAIAAEERELIFQALDQLPDHYSQVIRLRNLEFESFVVIGQRMNLSTEAARKMWERAVAHLARTLKGTHD